MAYIARRLKVTGPNQLWIADITYIGLREEFVYLALILDAYSRKVVGWTLDRTLCARLSLSALEQAIVNRELRRDLCERLLQFGASARERRDVHG